MVEPPRRSLPSSAGDVQLRRLGRGGSSDGPLRGQVVVALVLILIVLGVPLYLLRRPTLDEQPVAAKAPKPTQTGVARSHLDAGVVKPRVLVTDVQRVKCSAAPNQRGNEGPQCDPLPTLEEMLKKAIHAQLDCAPSGGEGTINYVLNVDFNKRTVRVFPGKSGSWKGPQAKKAAQCVEQAFPTIKWETITHRYRFYTLAMLARYSAPSALDIVPSFE